MAQVVDGKAEILQKRIMSGPHPVLQGMTYEDEDQPLDTGDPNAPQITRITGGWPVWDGFGLKEAQNTVNIIGITAFLVEYQHKRGLRRGALWDLALLNQTRVTQAPHLVRVVVGVDPAASSDPANAETGIVAAGRDANNHVYILRDVSGHYSPQEWAQQALGLHQVFDGDAIIGESNHGGEMVEAVIIGEDPFAPFELVHASRGKQARAEPIALLYQRGLVHHVGRLQQLEEQMCTPYDPGSTVRRYDRMDALVWAVHELTQEVDQLSNLDRARHTYKAPTGPGEETLLSMEEMKKQVVQVARGGQIDADLSHWDQLRTAMNRFVGELMKTEQIGVATRIRHEIERVDEVVGGPTPSDSGG